MKFFLSLTLLTAIIINTSATQPITQRFLNPNAVIRQLFEIFRNAIKYGSPENDLPVLDPAILFKDEINIQHFPISLKANLTNSTIRGLGDFQLKNIDFLRDNLTIDIELVLPKLIWNSDHYQMEGGMFGMPLYGEGMLRFEMFHLKILSRLYLTPSGNGKSTLVEKFVNPQFSVRKVLSHTEYDGNIDCIFNSIIEDVLATYLTRFNKYIAKIYSETTLKYLNIFLDKFETWRIISSLL